MVHRGDNKYEGKVNIKHTRPRSLLHSESRGEFIEDLYQRQACQYRPPPSTRDSRPEDVVSSQDSIEEMIPLVPQQVLEDEVRKMEL